MEIEDTQQTMRVVQRSITGQLAPGDDATRLVPHVHGGVGRCHTCAVMVMNYGITEMDNMYPVGAYAAG